MKKLIFSALAILAISPALAEDMSLQDKLDIRKAQFSAEAPEVKKAEYEKGVDYVRDLGIIEKAKNNGDKAPDFTMKDATEKEISLTSLLKNGPVVMVWYRGEWCPYCNIQLEDIQSHMSEFEALGAQVVAISPQVPDRGMALQDRLNLKFHVLSDIGSKVAKDYGVAYTLPDNIAARLMEFTDLHEGNADDSNILPLGAAYVIDKEGIIRYTWLDADYRKRVETSTLIEEVKKLK